MSKTVLDLTAQDAKEYFLKEKSYHNFDLPPYLKFAGLLSALDKGIGKSNLGNCIKPQERHPKEYEEVNYKLFGNKNGKYDWRKFQLIHPVLYILLVNTITESNNWNAIINRFKEFRKRSMVDCVSIPIISLTRLTNTGTQINHWLNNVEQRSIELSLKYEFLFKTDITSYYSSIYTHSICWALHGKTTAKEQRQNKALLGNKIDGFMMEMNNGQTNGIPEGSVLMDFISEIVLGYADKQLTDRLKEKKLKEKFKIIRYRDDFRIFTNNSIVGDIIIKTLTEVLIDLGLKINSSKTVRSQSVLKDSLKEGKLASLDSHLLNKRTITSYIKTLQVLHLFAERYPNSGALTSKLSKLYKQLESQEKINGNIIVVVAYVVDIAIKNPNTYPTCTAILSKILTFVSSQSKKKELIKDIYRKILSIPNTGFLEIWLQRIIINEKNFLINFSEKLCKIVEGKEVELWESNWLKPTLRSIIDSNNILDIVTLKNTKSIIDSKEINPFHYEY